MIRILRDIHVNEARMLENLMTYKDTMMSESVMGALVSKGMPRQEAHRLLQQMAFESEDKGKKFEEILTSNSVVGKYLTKAEISAALDPKSYLGMTRELVDSAVQKASSERRARGLST
jgi:adenylosuccinate lyase